MVRKYVRGGVFRGRQKISVPKGWYKNEVETEFFSIFKKYTPTRTRTFMKIQEVVLFLHMTFLH